MSLFLDAESGSISSSVQNLAALEDADLSSSLGDAGVSSKPERASRRETCFTSDEESVASEQAQVK